MYWKFDIMTALFGIMCTNESFTITSEMYYENKLLWTIMKYENKFYIAISLQAQKKS